MKTIISRFFLLAWLTVPAITATAALSYSWAGPQAIPDNDGSGLAYHFNVSDPTTNITDVAVTLNISGRLNGDLYVYLSHGDGFAVLLNRVGRTNSSDYGYSTPGMLVTLTGSATADIHNYQTLGATNNGSGQLTGTWAADGRDVNPDWALDITARTATLASFNGLNPNGDWTIYFRDASPSGISTLNSFSVDITTASLLPVITGQPTNQTVVAGSPVTFTVTAGGVAPLAYQWQFNGTNLVSATNASYSIDSVVLSDAGSYVVVVLGAGGSTVSTNATLTVNQNTATVTLGSLSQTYDGTAKVATATTSPTNLTVILTYNGSVAAPTNAGSYTVIGTVNDANYQGSATNLLVVNQAMPTVTNWPTATAIIYRQMLASSTLAGGAASVSGSFGFTIPSTAPAGTAPQSVTFTPTNAADYATVLGSVSVVVLMPPSITTQPTNQALVVGGTVNLSVSTTGDAPLSFQWFKNGGMVLGATNNALTLPSAGVPNSGVYYVVVTNAYGLNLSKPVAVTVGTPQLLAWGNNGYGQLGDGTKIDKPLPESVASDVVAAAAGAGHTLFVKADGTLWAVGFNGDGELGDGTTTTRTNAISVASNVVAVAAGAWHSLYLKRDGTLWGMGANYNGQLGDGTSNQQINPERVASNVVAVAAGWYHSLYLKSDGTLWGMGYNADGELGDGTTIEQFSPESVASNVVAVAAGSWHSLYLKSDGTLWAMGVNSNGQLGDGTNTEAYLAVSVASNVVALAAGSVHSLFLTKDETLWAMGDNGSGQLGNGTNTDAFLPESVAINVVAVTAGYDYSLYLKSDGTLWATGDNSSGDLGDGTTTTRYYPVAVPGMSLATVVSSGSAFHTLAMGVPLAPVITSQPTNQSVVVGSPVTFTVTAEGVTPLAYQWQFNGTNVVSATNTSYTVASVVLDDAGSYAVVVTGPDGSTVSSTAILTVSATVTVAAYPTNAGSVTGGGAHVVGETNVILSATASNNWQFIEWNDGATNNPYVITMPATNITYTAQFAAVVTINVGSNTNAGGSVTGGGTFLVGSTNLISAVASNGWIFVGWSDGSTNNPYAIVVASNLTYTANFALAAMVTTLALPPQGGSTAGDGTYAIGSSASVLATTTNGWVFLNWNGSVTNNPWTFVVPSSATVCTANFAQISTVTGLANPTNAGSVAGGGVYLVGSNAVLTATASNNWQFVAWNDGATNNPYGITVPETNITYTASFAATATMTVGANPMAGGSVTGGGTFLVGTTNLIAAVASNNWVFVAWNDGATTNPYTIVVASNLTLTATFVPAAMVTTVALPPEGGLTAGDGTYAVGSSALLTATATNGWVFLNWNGTVTNNPWSFVVPSSATVCTANFAPSSIVTALASPTNAGSVMGGGAYLVGSNAVLTAMASNTWQFVQWNDGTTNNPRTITAPATNITYTATFAPTATITVVANPSAAGSVSGGGNFLVGTTNWITAAASNNWVFVRWSDNSTHNPYAIVVASNQTFTAEFTAAATVTTLAVPPQGGSTAGDGTYAIGSLATLTATPSNGWVFLNWNETVTNYMQLGDTNNPLGIRVVSSVTYVANFAQVENGFVYTVISPKGTPEAKIIGYTGTKTDNIVVPSVIGGLAVTVIGGGAFWWHSFGKISLPGSVETIEAGAMDAGTVEFLAGAADGACVVIEAGAFAEMGEILMGVGVSALLIDYLVNMFKDLAMVQATADPDSGGSCTGSGLYTLDTTAVLTAWPNNGWRFTGWSDGPTTKTRSVVVGGGQHLHGKLHPAQHGYGDGEPHQLGYRDGRRHLRGGHPGLAHRCAGRGYGHWD